MNEKNIERLKKILADSSKRIERHLYIKAKDVLGQLLDNKKDDKKKS
jgi:hypothetical protein